MLLGTLAIEVVADTTKADKSIKSFTGGLGSVSRQASKTGKNLGNMFGGFVIDIQRVGEAIHRNIIQPLWELGKSTILAASSAEEMKNLFDVVFSKAGASANKMADSIANSTGEVTSSVQRLLGTFGDMAFMVGFTQKQAVSLGGALIKRAADIASFRDVAGGTAEVMDRLQRGINGQTRNLKLLGINILQDSKSFINLKKSIMASTGASVEQARQLAIIKIIMQATTNASGDLARTWTTFANQARVLGNSFVKIKEAIGFVIMRIFQFGKIMTVINIILSSRVFLFFVGVVTAATIVIGSLTAAMVGLGAVFVVSAILMAADATALAAMTNVTWLNIAAVSASSAARLTWNFLTLIANKSTIKLTKLLARLMGVEISYAKTQWLLVKVKRLVIAATWGNIVVLWTYIKTTFVAAISNIKLGISALFTAKGFLIAAGAIGLATLALVLLIVKAILVVAVFVIFFRVATMFINVLTGTESKVKTLTEMFEDLKLVLIGIVAFVIEVGVQFIRWGQVWIAVFEIVGKTVWSSLKWIGRQFKNFFDFIIGSLDQLSIQMQMALTGQEVDFSGLTRQWQLFQKSILKTNKMMGKDMDDVFANLELPDDSTFMDRLGHRILKLTGEEPIDVKVGKDRGKGKAAKPEVQLPVEQAAKGALEGSLGAFRIIQGAQRDLAKANADANERTADNTADISEFMKKLEVAGAQ